MDARPDDQRPGYSVRIRDMAASSRPRERLAQDGADALSEAELLAIILRVGSDRGSAVELAQSLLAAMGGLSALESASVAELCAHHGIGRAKAVQIKAALELGRRLQREPLAERPEIRSPADAARILAPRMAALPRETLQVILLDGRHRMMDVTPIAEGRVNTVGASMADVFRDAVRRDCPAVILAHNHPSGDPSPSDDDAKLTRTAAEAGKLLGVEVLDHVVIARGPTDPPNYASLREHGVEW